ncbi:hypothetical protein RSOL_194750 [Rhizoctonia solani AG-3 Rhs1AP]|uniref:Uncharacterized protein n=1 Tax=Rhizoctonia solani AG-3 Rhs1AP TaxID=1086054 RepID=X8J692_9AGAM|nr:hypothetical protein RSOL_194750 [Rhizoctonia solani AG-3 Rhs1AP]
MELRSRPEAKNPRNYCTNYSTTRSTSLSNYPPRHVNPFGSFEATSFWVFTRPSLGTGMMGCTLLCARGWIVGIIPRGGRCASFRLGGSPVSCLSRGKAKLPRRMSK